MACFGQKTTTKRAKCEALSLSFKGSFCGCDATLVMFDAQKFNFYVWGDWISNFIWNISDKSLTLFQPKQKVHVLTNWYYLKSLLTSVFLLQYVPEAYLLDHGLDISL